jgi:hypothetical protein
MTTKYSTGQTKKDLEKRGNPVERIKTKEFIKNGGKLNPSDLLKELILNFFDVFEKETRDYYKVN